MEKLIEIEVIEKILKLYDIHAQVNEQKLYIHEIEDNGWIKVIFCVTLDNGRMLIIKILHEDKDLDAEIQKSEKQSCFSEIMRHNGIKTPARHMSDGKYTFPFVYHNLPCMVTVEDWCGEEITEITVDIAYQIGELMARMHTISLDNNCKIGHRTLFSAAYWNDVDNFPEFCEITKDKNLNQAAAAQIKELHDKKLKHIREVWETLPKSAVQGDISINNLTQTEYGLTIFDYNNAGDEVLISDLILEGLLTAYEMDLPSGTLTAEREKLFPAFLEGYLSVRPLSEVESNIAWEIYTLYHGLWFSRIVHNDNSLDELVKSGDYDAANNLLNQILADMEEVDDGRFGK